MPKNQPRMIKPTGRPHKNTAKVAFATTGEILPVGIMSANRPLAPTGWTRRAIESVASEEVSRYGANATDFVLDGLAVLQYADLV